MRGCCRAIGRGRSSPWGPEAHQEHDGGDGEAGSGLEHRQQRRPSSGMEVSIGLIGSFPSHVRWRRGCWRGLYAPSLHREARGCLEQRRLTAAGARVFGCSGEEEDRREEWRARVFHQRLVLVDNGGRRRSVARILAPVTTNASTASYFPGRR
jgi:hypothetical protein